MGVSKPFIKMIVGYLHCSENRHDQCPGNKVDHKLTLVLGHWQPARLRGFVEKYFLDGSIKEAGNFEGQGQ